MGKRCFFDLDVQETFGLFGLEIAVYFEALRYRQQLHKGEFFKYKVEDVTKNCGLSYKQQMRGRIVLETEGWIEMHRSRDGLMFKVTDKALKATAKTPRRQNLQKIQQMRQNLVNRKA